MSFLSITFITLFLLSHHYIHHPQANTPVDRFTINCGASVISSDGERTWMGDTDSMLLSSQDSTVSAKPTSQSPSTNHVPFTTARLSRSQFNYSFPVTPGPKFLRLFFYPASYPSFPHTDSSFKVQCNQFLLLDSFNASLNVDAVKKETIFREYIFSLALRANPTIIARKFYLPPTNTIISSEWKLRNKESKDRGSQCRTNTTNLLISPLNIF